MPSPSQRGQLAIFHQLNHEMLSLIHFWGQKAKAPAEAGAFEESNLDQNCSFIANCNCRDEPESPVGKRVDLITPKVVLPTRAVPPG